MTRFYNKYAFVLLAMLYDKHRRRNWLDNERIMEDHKNYLNFITGITDGKLVDDSSDDNSVDSEDA